MGKGEEEDMVLNKNYHLSYLTALMPLLLIVIYVMICHHRNITGFPSN